MSVLLKLFLKSMGYFHYEKNWEIMKKVKCLLSMVHDFAKRQDTQGPLLPPVWPLGLWSIRLFLPLCFPHSLAFPRGVCDGRFGLDLVRFGSCWNAGGMLLISVWLSRLVTSTEMDHCVLLTSWSPCWHVPKLWWKGGWALLEDSLLPAFLETWVCSKGESWTVVSLPQDTRNQFFIRRQSGWFTKRK